MCREWHLSTKFGGFDRHRVSLPTFLKIVCAFCATFLLFLFNITTGVVCAAPVVSSGDPRPSDAAPQEIKLGEQTREEIAKYFSIVRNPVYQARVETIVARLQPYMERDLPYEVTILDHEMVNAFAIAGGGMYVATGMLNFVKSDLELAGIIAHEMAHADRKHVITQMARNERMTLLAIAAAIASKGKAAALIAANALQVAVMGAYSIDIEKEADAHGIQALTRAGYNPVGMLTLQERIKEEAMKRPHVDYGIYQTHPETDERIAAAVAYMEDNGVEVNRKYSLGLLRAKITSQDGTLSLELDGETLLKGSSGDATASLFERIAADLSQYLQLEMAPFDVRVQGEGANRSLWVGGKRIVRASELGAMGGGETVEKLRESVHRALSAARNSHPMADYFK